MLVQGSWLKTRHSAFLSLSLSLFLSLPLLRFLCLSFSACVSLTSVSHSGVCVCVPFGKSERRCAHRDEGDSSPISFRQGEGRVPPGTSTQLHLRGPCYGRRICSFACKSLPGAIRLPPYTGAQEHWRLINMKGVWTLLCKHVLGTVIFFLGVVSITCAPAPGNIEMTFPDISCDPCVIKMTQRLTYSLLDDGLAVINIDGTT